MLEYLEERRFQHRSKLRDDQEFIHYKKNVFQRECELVALKNRNLVQKRHFSPAVNDEVKKFIAFHFFLAHQKHEVSVELHELKILHLVSKKTCSQLNQILSLNNQFEMVS